MRLSLYHKRPPDRQAKDDRPVVNHTHAATPCRLYACFAQPSVKRARRTTRPTGRYSATSRRRQIDLPGKLRRLHRLNIQHPGLLVLAPGFVAGHAEVAMFVRLGRYGCHTVNHDQGDERFNRPSQDRPRSASVTTARVFQGNGNRSPYLGNRAPPLPNRPQSR